MMIKAGFIGMGNMAQAIVKGLKNTAAADTMEIYAYAPNQQKLRENAEKIDFVPCENLKELVENSQAVIMACKPYQVEEVLGQIKEQLKGKVLLSVANNWDFAAYEPLVDESTRVQYIMPNTPAQVGEGVFLLEKDNSLRGDERTHLKVVLEDMGTVIELPAYQIPAACAATGCGPAFVDLMMEGLGDGLVKNGIPRAEAYKMVAQMVAGAAKLMLSTGEHPGVLKDAVCSPGGTTIKGVIALEHAGVRAAFVDAVDAACGK